MALVFKDRVKETTATTGTGTVTLAGAESGFQAFSVIGDGNQTYYAIVGGTEFEIGLGTYTASGTTLSRDTVYESSNSGSLVNFSAGDKDVFVTYPAERAVAGSQGLTENSAIINTTYEIADGNNALSSGPITIESGGSVTVPSGYFWTII